ncbi:hypothetical protein NUU61_009460 [Penicillium alfredii]|uniref:Uncharacterized protein n=1 Tax=Penicillium alfredii TaxID=1506179 RepID=A0A9W9ENF1_9EURO|nr:uncharacterized protein NUU61_009460 [Penicillium alfredii]KAJ5084881.1 hypothetical protein NUU61_009460 [Penicillium alfredii]
MAPLQEYIDNIPTLALADAIQAIIDLTPGLTTSVSATGDRLVAHPDYEGQGSLSNLGRYYLECAARCQTEHASFKVRLLHLTLDEVFDTLYRENNKIFEKGVKDGSVTLPEYEEGCACCNGDPDALILAGFSTGESLLFTDKEYRQLWGDQESQGSSHRNWVDGKGWTDHWLRASKEQVEEAMARNAIVPSML